MSDPVRLIKKYPNRRLYDTKTSAYITLGDVKDLVLKFESFKVLDAKSGDDLTRSILLQIILEEETGGVPMFSSELLSGFIRFYGSAMQGMLGKYLENNMKAFVDFQQKMQDQSRSMYGDNTHMQADFWAQFLNFQQPAMQSMMTAYMDQSKKMFQSMQDQIQSQTRNIFSGFPPVAEKDEK
ncbi:MAG: polyhydroxyalkanoate synthesis repressor PhaR [Azonexus sp.]|nr:polyhydroxyalkanoate synthesis repressor PhaR [Azonexus sp.]MCK6413321.1 polyhydroxyalkanoate synthesis repressor PhaR [Azonexus sp.]